MSDAVPDKAPDKLAQGAQGAVHWLVRIAERAGLGDYTRPEIPPGEKAQDAWSEVTKA
jgi:hypothetical protein